MICQECGLREANICFATVINGEKHEQYLCAECMAKKQLLKFDLSALAGLAKKRETAIQTQDPEKMPDISCPRCGMSYVQYAKSGLLGCAQCYEAFRPELTDHLIKTLENSQYAGRIPAELNKQVSLRMERDKLKRKMNHAIEAEEYEMAATLRDRIRQLNTLLEEENTHHA